MVDLGTNFSSPNEDYFLIFNFFHFLTSPGSYPIKSTMSKLMESNIRTPSQFSIRGRTKFGDPNAKALSKTAANEPG
jgi:hypothetical protein